WGPAWPPGRGRSVPVRTGARPTAAPATAPCTRGSSGASFHLLRWVRSLSPRRGSAAPGWALVVTWRLHGSPPWHGLSPFAERKATNRRRSLRTFGLENRSGFLLGPRIGFLLGPRIGFLFGPRIGFLLGSRIGFLLGPRIGLVGF